MVDKSSEVGESFPCVFDGLPHVSEHFSWTKEDLFVVVEHFCKVVDESVEVVECSPPVVEVLGHNPGSSVVSSFTGDEIKGS